MNGSSRDGGLSASEDRSRLDQTRGVRVDAPFDEPDTRGSFAGSGLLPLVVISCQVLQDMFDRLLPADVASAVEFMDYGLHREPGLMTQALQEAIDRIEDASLVVLGFGLCGNGLSGLRAGHHTLLLPRVHDHIVKRGAQSQSTSWLDPSNAFPSRGGHW